MDNTRSSGKLLANVYAPNFDNAHFAQDLLLKFPALNTHLLIIGGDLNCVIDPDLDKSSIVTKAPSAMSKIFSEFMVQNGYIVSHCEEILILLMCPSIFLSYRLFLYQ